MVPLADAGVSIFHYSQRRFWESEFSDSDLNLAGWTTKLTGKPAITVGSVGLDGDFLPEDKAGAFNSANTTNIDNLIKRMYKDEFQLVAVGRALIANPDWANKVKSGQTNTLVAFNKHNLKELV